MPSSTATSRSYTIRRLFNDVETTFREVALGRLPAGFAGLPRGFVRDVALAILLPFGRGADRLFFSGGLPEDGLQEDV